jgi:acylglycerol lipase
VDAPTDNAHPAATQSPQLVTLQLSVGYKAKARWWPQRSARGSVLYLHGIQSHGGWFERSAAALADAGFNVLLPDRRGSGLNQRDRGHADSVRQLIGDLDCAVDFLQQHTGDDPVHLIGVSWGGKLAIAYARRRPRRVASLTLVAPGIFSRVDLPLGEKLKVAVCALVSRRRPFAIPLNEPRLFTNRPEGQAFIAGDHLRLLEATTSFLVVSRRLDMSAQNWRGRGFAGPLHCFLAEHDEIIDNRATRAFIRRMEWVRRHITEYRGAWHTLEFEPPNCSYVSDLVRVVGEFASSRR